MRVLEVTDFYYPWIAGPAPFIRNLSAGLVDRGHDVVITCPSPTGRPYEEQDSPRRHRVRTVSVPFGYNLRAGFPLIDIARLLRRFRPDVVHIQHPFPISVAGLLVAKAQGIPVVATNHTIPECTLFGIQDSTFYGLAKAALAAHIRLVLGRADAVTTPTETAANFLRGIGFRKPILPISNGVDTDWFTPAPSPPVEPLILYTGRLDDDKDMDTLMRALPAVLRQIPSAKVRIGGEGTDRARLERLVSELGIADRVRFTGYVPNDELPEVYRQASVYCISSRVELQSISTLEAMASGLPVVAVDAGALPELVRNGVNGFLTVPGDVDAFGAALARVLSNPELQTKFGLASRTIAQTHSVGSMVAQYEQVLGNVVMSPASRKAYGAANG